MSSFQSDENIPPNRRWSLGILKRKFMTEDNQTGRAKWTGRADFFLSCLGFAVGLGNVWRFPYLSFRNGGGAFFLPYFAFLFGVGIPLMVLEFAIGNFSSTGPYRSWEFVVGLKGIGLVMTIISVYISCYYVVLIAWAIWYFFASFSGSELAWTHCGEWSTPLCQENIRDVNLTFCRSEESLIPLANGTCYNVTTGTLYGIYNKAIALENGIKPQLPSADYLNYVGLQKALSPSIEDIGVPRLDMSLYLLLAWILVFSSLLSGIKTTGKVVYFTATFPYVILTILFICGIVQEGSMKGIIFYVTPNITKLGEPQVWKDAASQIFFSLSLSTGGLIVYSSYNRFRKDVVRDAILCSVCNCGTSIFAGFVIFSFIGGFAKSSGISVEDIVLSDIELAYIIYAQACTKLPAPQLWAVLFYLMLFILGLDSAFGYIETIVMCVTEIKPDWLKYRRIVLAVVCVTLYLFGLSMTTPGGVYVVEVLDNYSLSFNVMVLALLECVAIWIYGPWRLLNDIHLMVGDRTMKIIPWKAAQWCLIVCWCIITPSILLFIFLFGIVSYKKPEKSPIYIGLGQFIMISTLVPLFVCVVMELIKAKGSAKEKIKELCNPSVFWGPYALKDRKLVTYAKGFVVNPRHINENTTEVASPNATGGEN